ncbi:MAG: ABC transporter ATP-binding protein [Candidatus Bathyarchaeota archaeon]|nr:ABC transporter ATP-binding protein [Candidatus Bathyarchaeota archaeon]
MEEKESILVVKNLTKHFKTSFGIVHAVDNIEFDVRFGETFGLVGESGSGKTTTGYVIMGIYTPTAGRIVFKGHDISLHTVKRPKSIKKDMSMVFQDPASSLNPSKTIREIVGLPLKVHGMVNGSSELDEKVAKLLEVAELPPERFMYRRPRDLGGGEKQAVAIARAIATNPSFVVLDEPTSALDVSVQAKVIKTLMKLQQELNLSYLFITHDLSLMRNVASRVAIMYLGRICEYAPAAMFFQNPLHPYTKMLLSSVAVLTDKEEALKPKGVKSIGEVPSAINPPPGCRFHTRCAFAKNICKVKEPELAMIESEHYVACHLY